MTYLSLKIIAVITMTIDHIGAALQGISASGQLQTLASYMRNIGRIAFPIYAFGIVNGHMHTSNKERYFYRLALFMPISQIPFSIVQSPVNLIVGFKLKDLLTLDFSLAKPGVFLWLSLLLLISFALVNRDNKKSIVVMFFAILLSAISITSKKGYVLNDPYYLNVFYTLGAGAYFLNVIDDIKGMKLSTGDMILKSLSLILMLAVFSSFADYAFAGIILIVGIYFFWNKKPAYLSFIAAWLILGYSGLARVLTSLLSVLFIGLYNGEKGQAKAWVQKFFYIYYPLHLWIGAIISFIMFS